VSGSISKMKEDLGVCSGLVNKSNPSSSPSVGGDTGKLWKLELRAGCVAHGYIEVSNASKASKIVDSWIGEGRETENRSFEACEAFF
jgi:hypothetical protein